MCTKYCLYCEIPITGHRTKKYCSTKCNMLHWHEKNPDRNKVYQKKYAQKFSRPKNVFIQCETCGKSVEAKRSDKRFCSQYCSVKARTNPKTSNCKVCGIEIGARFTYCEDHKPPKKSYKKYIKKEPREVECAHCGTLFMAKSHKAKYCKQTCSPAHRAAKKARKRHIRQARLKVESWAVIGEFMDNRPEGAELDHIIPLNHPDICGLHNTWNFQWLSKDENNDKSNKFDGTLENNTWKDS